MCKQHIGIIYIDQQKSVDVPEMALQLDKHFGIDLDRSKIMEKIDKEMTYYSGDASPENRRVSDC